MTRRFYEASSFSRGVALPTDATPDVPPESAPRPELRLIEARDARERRCADCGKRTEQWKPVRRKGTVVLLCPECAAKPPPPDETPPCPQCGAVLRTGDTFCGKCGTRIEYACAKCGATLEPDDTFCGRCGARLA